ncbi:hypothetical protein V5799_005623 [Amblyomma americanum]|uniref:C2H2-type domain-containing protein n=1 Tax=Amblyomma americanum TaxID=6943 RepID=A0AAQ4DYR0_AMBAM
MDVFTNSERRGRANRRRRSSSTAAPAGTWSIGDPVTPLQSNSPPHEIEKSTDGSSSCGTGSPGLHCSSSWKETSASRNRPVKKEVFRCDHCPYTTTSELNLKTHARTHTGEKPFTCTVCQAAFTQMGKYKRHMLRHTWERPFKCSVCPYSAAQKDTLQRHQRTHPVD